MRIFRSGTDFDYGKEFRVVRIISEYEIIINAGSNDGYQVGDIFQILVQGKPLTDPETGEELGVLDYVKARIQLSTVFPKMSICRSTATSNPMFDTATMLLGVIGSLGFGPAKLNVDEDDITGDFDDVDEKIGIGDKAYFMERPKPPKQIEQGDSNNDNLITDAEIEAEEESSPD